MGAITRAYHAAFWRQPKRSFLFSLVSLCLVSGRVQIARRCVLVPHMADVAVHPLSLKVCVAAPSLPTRSSSTRKFRIVRRSREARPGPLSDGGDWFSIRGGREGLGRAGRAVPGLPGPSFSPVGQGAFVLRVSQRPVGPVEKASPGNAGLFLFARTYLPA